MGEFQGAQLGELGELGESSVWDVPVAIAQRAEQRAGNSLKEGEQRAESAAKEYHIEAVGDWAVERRFEGVEVGEDGFEDDIVGLGFVEVEETREEREDQRER